MVTSPQHFEVSKEGLGRILGGRPKGRIVAELISNALDEQVTEVKVAFTPVPGKSLAKIQVEDNSPKGFSDLKHAWVLFDKSEKGSDPTKRGRFNLGEKLVISVCESATISSTTGTVSFDKDGRKERLGIKRPVGTCFLGEIKMNREEYNEALAFVENILIPEGISVTLNGRPLSQRKPVFTFEASLETERTDDAGILRRTIRKTIAELYEPERGEKASIFEMGIPVVETGDKWSYNILQKVPLNMDRDNVTPAYLQTLRVLVLNNAYSFLAQEDGNMDWVRTATNDERGRCTPEALNTALTLRFGDKRVLFDPSDKEAMWKAVANGYTIIPNRGISSNERAAAKKYGLAKPAGQVFPTAKVIFEKLQPGEDPSKSDFITGNDLTPGMINIREYTRVLADHLMGVNLRVDFVDSKESFEACYGGQRFTYNVRALGRGWFDQGATEEVDKLIAHEFAHEYESNHLSTEYHEAICLLFAKMKLMALKNPQILRHFMLEN